MNKRKSIILKYVAIRDGTTLLMMTTGNTIRNDMQNDVVSMRISNSIIVSPTKVELAPPHFGFIKCQIERERDERVTSNVARPFLCSLMHKGTNCSRRIFAHLSPEVDDSSLYARLLIEHFH